MPFDTQSVLLNVAEIFIITNSGYSVFEGRGVRQVYSRSKDTFWLLYQGRIWQELCLLEESELGSAGPLARNHPELKITHFVTEVKITHNPHFPHDFKIPKTYIIFVISFTQAAFSNSKFYTQKLTKNTPKHSKMSMKSKIYAVFVFNLENFTPDRIFLHGHRPWCPWQLWGLVTSNTSSACVRLLSLG